MDKLRQYINALNSDEQSRFAAGIGTSVGYLRKAMSVGSLLSPALCSDIERATGRAVTRTDLRPDDWARIWPELTANSPEKAA